MDLGLAGKVALVTAASKGLGRATAAALAAEGARVVICARGDEGLSEAAAGIDGEVLGLRADVSLPQVPAELVDATLGAFGRLDILVANAGGPPPGRALDVTDDQLVAALDTNLLASIRLARAAVPHMQSSGWGRIVFIASSSVRQPIPDLALSNVARTGLWAWAKTAAQDLRGDGITVNLACPGLHLTDRVKELGHGGDGARLGDPADFGKVVTFLCSEPANFVSGVALGVDGASVAGLL